MPAEKKKKSVKVTKLYRRTRFKNSLESSLDGKKITGDTDVLMYMNFLMFLDRLAKASEQAAEERGSSRVREPDVAKYLQKTLREFRG
ncbi:hypothetical protein G6F42_019071 [Rhizopus arrhizus]|nr:hypothetical protein G6F42_019071 [Rhizopus arrhizus]